MTRSRNHGLRLVSSRHDQELFQSSRRSWSSRIITVGIVASSQRTAGVRHDSW